MNIEKLDLLASGNVCRELNISRNRLRVLVEKYEVPYKQTSAGKIFLKKDIAELQRKQRKFLKHKRRA